MILMDRIARERRLRNKLTKRGFKLIRSRRRKGPLPSGYLIVEYATGQVVAGGEPALFSLTLDDVEVWARQFDG